MPEILKLHKNCVIKILLSKCRLGRPGLFASIYVVRNASSYHLQARKYQNRAVRFIGGEDNRRTEYIRQHL